MDNYSDLSSEWVELSLGGYFQELVRSYGGRRVLVTGADGFLGFNCVLALSACKAEVTIVSRRQRARAESLAARVIRADMRDAAAMQEAVRNSEIVFDLAGNSGAVQSNCDPQRNLLEECQSHLVLLHACAEAQPSPLVLFCSSRLVYGKPKSLPVAEDHPLSPESIYAAHKITAENYLRVFRQTAGLRSIVVRLTNPYGPHQAHESKGYGIMNRFIRAASRGEEITLFGDGSQRRDYIFVGDVIRGFLLLPIWERCWNETFNVGGLESVSIRAAADQIAQLTGTKIKIVPWPDDFAAVETGDFRSDCSKLQSLTGFRPKTSLAEGLQRTLEFYRDLQGIPETAPLAS